MKTNCGLSRIAASGHPAEPNSVQTDLEVRTGETQDLWDRLILNRKKSKRKSKIVQLDIKVLLI